MIRTRPGRRGPADILRHVPAERSENPSTLPWRAPENLGAVDGLRQYEQQLRAAGHPPLRSVTSVASVLNGVLTMAARGSIVRLRLGAAAGTPLIGKRVRLRGARYIRTGRRLRVDDFAEIQGTSTRGIRFGNGVTIGKFVTIRPSGLWGRFLGVGLTVGDNTSIGPNCFLGCLGGIDIGSDVMLAPGVMVFAETHVFDSTERTIKSQGLDYQPVVIEDDCWIASGAIITGGVRVGKGSIVGAGAIVTKDVPPGSVVAGNPARPIRTRDDAE